LSTIKTHYAHNPQENKERAKTKTTTHISLFQSPSTINYRKPCSIILLSADDDDDKDCFIHIEYHPLVFHHNTSKLGILNFFINNDGYQL
jgi:hypothetical protein